MKKTTSVILALIVTVSAAALAVSAEGLSVLGDLNGDGKVTSNDAVYLLRSVLFPDTYALGSFGDFNGDGKVTSNDAVYLLRHVLFPEAYVLKTAAPYSEGLEYILDDDGRAWISGPGTFDGEELNIPPEIDGHPVIGVEYNAFEDTAVTSVTLSDGIMKIESNAFDYCKSLVAVYLPESVTNIGLGAFADCSRLTSAVLPAGVTNVEYYLFQNCSSLASAVIPDGVTFIGEWAFDGCKALTSVSVPDGVTEICKGTFYGCLSLKTVYLPAGITYIGESAFDSCRGLETIYFAGTRAQWENMEKGADWDALTGGYEVVCADD
ncbi:MAG: leucine-rich repeat protein [Clostridia bacterium]|nr:leucine-rich repeat protein [Clostridia bacterium]